MRGTEDEAAGPLAEAEEATNQETEVAPQGETVRTEVSETLEEIPPHLEAVDPILMASMHSWKTPNAS